MLLAIIMKNDKSAGTILQNRKKFYIQLCFRIYKMPDIILIVQIPKYRAVFI